jgi:hypothetical protein
MAKTKKSNSVKEKKIEKVIDKDESKKSNDNINYNQIYWFFGCVILLFIVFLGGYYIYQNYKPLEPGNFRIRGRFEHAGIEWVVEDYVDFIAYHGRFTSFLNMHNTHNLYLRSDPRINNVPVSGDFGYFKYGGFISPTPEADQCRGDMVGSILTMISFLRDGVGMTIVELGTTDISISEETNRTLADCTLSNRGVFIIKIGEESSVVQSDENPFCYIVTVRDCNDIAPVEKFMIETIRQKTERERIIQIR